MKGVLEFFKNLWMQYQANIDDPNIDDLCAAIEKGDFDEVNCLLKVKRIQDELEIYHNDILCFAVIGGYLEIVKLLLTIDIVENNITANGNRAYNLSQENKDRCVAMYLYTHFDNVRIMAREQSQKELKYFYQTLVWLKKAASSQDSANKFSKTESSRDGASKRAREEVLSDSEQVEPPKKRRMTELDKLVIDGESALILNEPEFPRRSKRLKKEALNDSEQATSLQKKRKG